MLLAQLRVDPNRIAYVGHDFGMIFGAVLAGVDERPTAFAFQAGTASFSEWYLLGRKLEANDRQKIVKRLSGLDPVRYIRSAAPRPEQILWYDAGQELNRQAVEDRTAWLKNQLHLQ